MSKTKTAIPTEFKKIIIDMTKDILVSFPEQEQHLHKELKNLVFEVDKDSLERDLKDFSFLFFSMLNQTDTLVNDMKNMSCHNKLPLPLLHLMVAEYL